MIIEDNKQSFQFYLYIGLRSNLNRNNIIIINEFL